MNVTITAFVMIRHHVLWQLSHPTFRPKLLDLAFTEDAALYMYIFGFLPWQAGSGSPSLS